MSAYRCRSEIAKAKKVPERNPNFLKHGRVRAEGSNVSSGSVQLLDHTYPGAKGITMTC